MVTTLSLIGVAVLLVLIVISLKRQRELGTARKRDEARAYTGEAEAQHEKSLRRRAGVRAAHAERVQTTAPGAEVQKAGSAAGSEADR